MIIDGVTRTVKNEIKKHQGRFPGALLTRLADLIVQPVTRHHDVVVINSVQLHSRKPELRFCAGSYPPRGVSGICNVEDLWQWSRLKIKLYPIPWSGIRQKQFIIISDFFLNVIKVQVFFRKNIEKKHLRRHDKNHYYFCISNVPVINLSVGSRNMIKVSNNISL